ncbi:MAG: NAD(P)-binding protein [Candidatus Lokiarchaeota archaeon]|nr:NAD(P)-binding protein [Candidatus Lokiarchaeota archaeon]MBD3338152.1 NAD(P)-binding protein [Candidatus Lokiarchaeota archaeon]
MVPKNFDESRVIAKFPVIVIGAGLGGLGAASQLALSGEQVLILEKHNVPGGFATSFVRGRFEFEGALHELSDIGTPDNKGSLYRFLERLGVIPDKLKFNRVPEFYRSVYYDGYDVTIPLGIEKYTNKLVELFPHEEKGILEFMEMCKAVLAGIEFVASKGGKFSPQEVLKEHPWLPRVSGLTLSELYDKFFEDKKLISVISQPWGYIGLPPERMNAYAFVAMIIFYLNWGAAFPLGRSHSLTSAIVEAFENLGGTIRFNSLVDRILTENGRVIGVELLNGDIYLCDSIISNVNPICTTMKMLPPEDVPDSYKKKIYAPEIGPSGFSVYVGLNASYKELGLTAHEHFINKSYDMQEAFQAFRQIEEPKYIVAACYNHIDETISPPGTTQLVLTTLQMGKLWESIAPDQYFSLKDKYADKMIAMVEDTISPDIREYIEVAVAATPLTYYRYSKNFEGAIYGTTQDVTNGPMLRLKSRGAIPGLYQVGAWTNFGGGFSTTILGGRIAAGMYFKDKKEGRW